MIKREFDADYINRVANHPSVRGGAKIDMLGGPADFTPLVNDRKNILLSYEGGCFLLMKKPDSYEIHTMALKEGRGKKLREAVKEMLSYMFLHVGCQKLETLCYRDNPSAIKLSKEFMQIDHEEEDMIHYSLNKQDWRAA